MKFAIAPMMDWTDRWCRRFHRQLTRRALLYTEMVAAAGVVRGDRERLIGFDPAEHPVALQIGGSDPQEVAEAARIGEAFGYREINLNVGCPSDRVRSGRFGACLMAEPERVGDCVAAMRAAVSIPVTVKCRLGIDDQDTGAPLDRFTAIVSEAGCDVLIVHARKAWLKGLSPKENRDIPPLDHARVHRLKADHPGIGIVLNGGITTLEQARTHLAHVDGVMMGRAAYQQPGLLAGVDSTLYGAPPEPGGEDRLVRDLLPWISESAAAGTPLHRLTRHMLGLFHGSPGARAWRRILTEDARSQGAGPEVVLRALAAIEQGRDRRAA